MEERVKYPKKHSMGDWVLEGKERRVMTDNCMQFVEVIR